MCFLLKLLAVVDEWSRFDAFNQARFEFCSQRTPSYKRVVGRCLVWVLERGRAPSRGSALRLLAVGFSSFVLAYVSRWV